MMASGLVLKIGWRNHNLRLVVFLLWALGAMARVLRPHTIETWANKILRLYWAEYRVAGGRWERVDHGLQVEIVDQRPGLIRRAGRP